MKFISEVAARIRLLERIQESGNVLSPFERKELAAARREIAGFKKRARVRASEFNLTLREAEDQLAVIEAAARRVVEFEKANAARRGTRRTK